MSASDPDSLSETRPDRARFRFPRAAHLFRASEFKLVREKGTLQRGRLLFVSLLRDREAGLSRWGVVTSKRVGPAVERNAVRRRLREVIRQGRGRVVVGGWFVVTARPGSAKATSAELQKEWEHLVGRHRAWAAE